MNYQAFDLLIETADEVLLHEALVRTHEIITDEQRFYILNCLKARKNTETVELAALLEHLKTFEQRSNEGFFYREFDIGGSNYTWVPPHTQAWFFELGLWLDKACKLAQAQEEKIARIILEACFSLIDNMTEFVFANETGDWMIHTEYDYQEVYNQLADK